MTRSAGPLRLFAVFAFGLLAACGKEEAHDHDAGKTPAKGAEMKTVTLAIEGMT